MESLQCYCICVPIILLAILAPALDQCSYEQAYVTPLWNKTVGADQQIRIPQQPQNYYTYPSGNTYCSPLQAEEQTQNFKRLLHQWECELSSHSANSNKDMLRNLARGWANLPAARM